ncbi:Na+/H+ antiporter NhaA [Glycomyces sp. TRM65418]|uniref:Na+/H+ antiporter NhaA n=1 Tax=Glycomyces sp. TRM65418 TaxID=2867006 RepID=UPI001D160CCA|nr:Na+/H+ antiporter NhaA [Glycomyces sp. TRM65418]MCC3763483.1 Na+/H+ antiporter NhaA [Glycomyces sp. TRM65418]
MPETPNQPPARDRRAMPQMPKVPRRRIVRKVKRVPSEALRFLRIETTGGILLLIGAALALIAANSPLSDFYEEVRHTYIGIEGVFSLNVQHWAADFLLAFFFLVVGLELKRELVVGELRDLKQAMLPVIAAVGGIVVPAVIALAVAWGEPGAADVWPVPVATDIAFALAVLAICARGLPSSLRIFLLTLAIADDLGAIAMIAVLFSSPRLVPLLIFAAIVGLWVFLQAKRVKTLWLYIPLGLAAWAALYEADVHATIAGVALGLATRVKPDPDEHEAPAIKAEHAIQPFSAGFAVPVFAFFSAGVALNGDALTAFAADRVALAVVAGLFFGKAIGVTLGAFAAHKLGWGKLAPDLRWGDIAGVAVLCGCGFTVSLLIAELAFTDLAQQDLVKTGVLAGSAVSAIVGGAMLARRRKTTP